MINDLARDAAGNNYFNPVGMAENIGNLLKEIENPLAGTPTFDKWKHCMVGCILAKKYSGYGYLGLGATIGPYVGIAAGIFAEDWKLDDKFEDDFGDALATSMGALIGAIPFSNCAKECYCALK